MGNLTENPVLPVWGLRIYVKVFYINEAVIAQPV
jgi:hypothetical protein